MKDTVARDRVFEADGALHDFVFDATVANVFDDMLERSVPFYAEVQRMVVELAAEFLDGGGTVYDVGCSTGNTLAGIAAATGRAIRLVGLEPSEAMRQQALQRLMPVAGPDRLQILPSTIENLDELPDARVVTMLYTLQFVRPIHRMGVMAMVRRSLQPGGCLLLAEKILADDPALRRPYIDLYHAFKMRSGYSTTEIARKREALENVLVPFEDAENLQLLRDVGFATVEHAFRWYNFALYVAIKR